MGLLVLTLMIFCSIVIIYLVAILAYDFQSTNCQLQATASAMQHIWSGSCQSACRRQNTSSLDENSDSQCNGIPIASQIPCVCEACQCDRIENFFRSYSTVANFYDYYINAITEGYLNVIKAIADFTEFVAAQFRCPICQSARATNIGSNQVPPPSLHAIESNLAKTASSSSKGKLKTDKKTEDKPGTSVSSGESKERLGCSKCAEKGQVCIYKCPNANKKH